MKWPWSKWFRSKYGDEVLEGQKHSDGSLSLTWKMSKGSDWELVTTRLPAENANKLAEWFQSVYPRRTSGLTSVIPIRNSKTDPDRGPSGT